MRNGCAALSWRDRRRRIVVSLFLLLSALAAPPLAVAQLTPPSTGGVARLDWLLHRLVGARRVLVIGAHPDDEDTALLALVSRGYGADAAYLSLSRGEGGQNLIGDELGTALGLIRSRELESARAIDGARQFFTRAYDFGYTRSLEETQRFWLPDSILKDVVRVVRLFRPHVIVTVFSGTPRDGHGQHQMAGVMARRAFAVAGDATVFPELAGEEGLQPWTALKLYWSTRFNRTGTTLVLPTGGLDPHSGRSYQQIAMASRSRHRWRACLFADHYFCSYSPGSLSQFSGSSKRQSVPVRRRRPLLPKTPASPRKTLGRQMTAGDHDRRNVGIGARLS